MHFNLIEMWAGMNNMVRLVVIVLTIQALACMAVTVDRIILLIGAYRRGRKFARKAGPVLASGDLQGALALAREDQRSHLAGFIRTGVETYLEPACAAGWIAPRRPSWRPGRWSARARTCRTRCRRA